MTECPFMNKYINWFQKPSRSGSFSSFCVFMNYEGKDSFKKGDQRYNYAFDFRSILDTALDPCSCRFDCINYYVVDNLCIACQVIVYFLCTDSNPVRMQGI